MSTACTAAGSRKVIDLHGRLDVVRCMAVRPFTAARRNAQQLLADNPAWKELEGRVAPDGDVDLERDCDDFVVPACARCGGILKPDVVFFGEPVPRGESCSRSTASRTRTRCSSSARR